MAHFGLYEAGGEDETFILVAKKGSYEELNKVSRLRTTKRVNNHKSRISERRFVPLPSNEKFPLHASYDEVMAMVRNNNNLYP